MSQENWTYPGEWAAPKPINEWTTEDLEMRATRYETNRRNKIEELELIDALLGPLRAEAMRRGLICRNGIWEVPRP